tara:strand:- start:1957 stop:3042 length:1086 start_codon:yes stop_codon:yes gene_type:complete
MTKILCTADNHLGYRQYGLQVREQDIYDSFTNILKLAVKEKVDAITISGDLLHATRPSSRTIAFLKECHDYLIFREIPAFVVAGNHDKSEPHWITTLCDVSAWDGQQGGFVLLENELVEVKDMVIHGAPFTNKKAWQNDKELMRPDTDILLMHQSFQEFIQFETEDAFSQEDVEGLAKVVVVGDIHVTMKAASSEIYSPGSSELMSSTEEPQKYVLMVDNEQGSDMPLNTHFVEIPTRKVIEGNITDEEEAEAFFEELRKTTALAPLVFVKCNFKLSGVIERIRALYEDKMVIRAKYYNPDVESAVRLESNVSLQEVLSNFVKQDEPLYELAVKLLDDECDARYEVDTYIEEALANSEHDL